MFNGSDANITINCTIKAVHWLTVIISKGGKTMYV